MSDHPARRRETRQEIDHAIEVCRGEGDLTDPLFAELAAAMDEDAGLRADFHEVRAADAAIAAAMMNVPVPAGLADRIARRLSKTAPPTPAPPVELVAAPVIVAVESPAPWRPATISRRSLIAGLAALATSAVLLLAAVWIHSHPASLLTRDRVMVESINFFSHDSAAPGKLFSEEQPPDDYPFSRDLANWPQIRWRRVQDFFGAGAVAYDLPPISGRATLYVLNLTVKDLPNSPPPTPAWNTGGNSAAAWQANGLMYVLVVQGDAQTYAAYLDHSQGPLT